MLHCRESVDGHDFVESACKSGAVAVLVMKDLPEEVIACAEESATAILRVSSTHEAFTQLASGYRGLLKGRVIGITGSTGKTTTKILCVMFYRHVFRVLQQRQIKITN